MDTSPTTTNARCIHARYRALDLGRLLGSFLLLAFAGDRVQAQEAEGDLVYKFTVVGIHHRAEAKPLQYALFERPTVHACDFIEECGCFKLASTVPLDYTTLNALLQESDNRLSGTVEVSDGSLLTPQQPLKR